MRAERNKLRASHAEQIGDSSPRFRAFWPPTPSAICIWLL